MENSQVFHNEELKKDVSNFPLLPGVYIMRNAEKIILYIGKAKELRKRVRSYFSSTTSHIKTAVLMRQVVEIEYIVTSSEQEALLLENTLIKRHQPRYNIDLKDSKSYPVIRITKEAFPRIFRTRMMSKNDDSYYGPYPNTQMVDMYLKIIERMYPLRKCRGRVKKRQNPCLYFHIGRCAGACAGKISQKDYLERVEKARMLLEGSSAEAEAQLQKGMDQASQELRFEDAAWYRDALNSLHEIQQQQSVIDFDPESRDYIGFQRQEELCVFTVLQMRNGRLLGSESFRSRSVEDDQDAMAEFISRYYSTLASPPRSMYTSIQLSDDFKLAAAESSPPYAEAQDTPAREPTAIKPAESTRDTAVLNMATENARQDLANWLRSEGDVSSLKELAAVLKLPQPPLRIEGFDIAQLQGKHTVASMVSFYRGAPDKSNYRRFHIRSLKGAIDDYEAIREAVARRYTRLVNEGKPLPDLILIDGGRGQVNAAKAILQALDLEKIPLVGLAKRLEEIILPDSKEILRLPEGSPPLQVLQYVRDEAHRFATGFNQQLRSGDISASILESVDGIGPAKSGRLLETFGSLKAIAQAKSEDLMSCASISEGTALQLILALEQELSSREQSETQKDA